MRLEGFEAVTFHMGNRNTHRHQGQISCKSRVGFVTHFPICSKQQITPLSINKLHQTDCLYDMKCWQIHKD